MTERSGLGVADLSILEALAANDAFPHRPYVKCAKVLLSTDVGPRYAYEMLCELAMPWMTPMPCVSFHGNLGSADFPPAGPRYTEARLSPVGMLALAAERGELGPVPIGLINGTTHCGGTRPPFDPDRMLTALTTLLTDPGLDDRALAGLVGPPAFPTGCLAEGDLEAFAAGQPTKLELTARLERQHHPQPAIIVSHLPPDASATDITNEAVTRVHRRPWADEYPELADAVALPLASLEDRSSGGETRLVFGAQSDADLDTLADRLRELWGVSHSLAVQLPAPLPEMLRQWVEDNRAEAIEDSLGQLRDAIT